MPAFTNQATLSFNNTLTNSNVVTGNIIEALNASKNAVVDTYSRGETVTYVVSLVNSSGAPYSNVTLQDNLGAYQYNTDTLVPLTYIDGSMKYYLNGVLQPTPIVSTENGLLLTDINIPAGGTALFVYEAEANGFAPLEIGGSIVNTVTVNGENLIDTITASETVTPAQTPILSITKSLSPTTVTENGQITYTFVIQNTGNTATLVEDDIFITDNFSPALQDITVVYNDDVLTLGTEYTYQNGVFSTVPGIINVPAATYERDAETGSVIINPGVSILTVTGTI